MPGFFRGVAAENQKFPGLINKGWRREWNSNPRNTSDAASQLRAGSQTHEENKSMRQEARKRLAPRTKTVNLSE